AEDALELIELDLEPLEAVVDVDRSMAADAPLLFEEWGTNVFYSGSYATGDFDKAMADADGILRQRIPQHRIIGLPLEGHGACGQFDPATGKLLLYSSTQ